MSICLRSLFIAVPALCLAAASSSIALAQDCDVLAKNGFFDERAVLKTDSYLSQAQSAVCQEEVKTLQQAKAAAASAGVSYGLFGANVAGANAEQNFSDWKFRFCSNSVSTLAQTGSVTETVKEASKTLTEAFVACIGQQGIRAWTSQRSDPRAFLISLRFNPDAANTPAPKILTASMVPSTGYLCEPSISTLVGTELERSLVINCLRQNAQQSFSFATNTSGGYTGQLDIPGRPLPIVPAPPAPPNCREMDNKGHCTQYMFELQANEAPKTGDLATLTLMNAAAGNINLSFQNVQVAPDLGGGHQGCGEDCHGTVTVQILVNGRNCASPTSGDVMYGVMPLGSFGPLQPAIAEGRASIVLRVAQSEAACEKSFYAGCDTPSPYPKVTRAARMNPVKDGPMKLTVTVTP